MQRIFEQRFDVNVKSIFIAVGLKQNDSILLCCINLSGKRVFNFELPSKWKAWFVVFFVSVSSVFARPICTWLIAQKETDCSFKSQFSLIELIKICTQLLYITPPTHTTTTSSKLSNEAKENKKKFKRTTSNNSNYSSSAVSLLSRKYLIQYVITKERMICILLRLMFGNVCGSTRKYDAWKHTSLDTNITTNSHRKYNWEN